MQKDDWFYWDDDKVQGPISGDELRQRVTAGEIPLGALVRKDGQAWGQAASLLTMKEGTHQPRSTLRRLSPPSVSQLLLVLVGVGSVSVLLQVCILLTLTGHKLDVNVANRELNVNVANSEIDVNVANSELDVNVNNTTPIDVNVENSTPIDVKLYDHWILSGDPIPVRIER